MTDSMPPKQEIGGLVPDFSLPVIGGGECRLGTIVKARKGTVVVFWSKTCSHCMRYDAYLNAFEDRHPDISLIAVACRSGEDAAAIRESISERGLKFQVAHDADGAVAALWHTQQTPRSFLINRSLQLLYRGAIDNFRYPQDPEYRAHLDPAVEAFLAGRPIARAETPSFGCAVQSVYYNLPKSL